MKKINNKFKVLVTMLLVKSMVFLPLVTRAQNNESITDSQLRQIIIKTSILAFPGECPCPYNQLENGNRCGSQSAYTQSGGLGVICYDADVNDTMVQTYRKNHKFKNSTKGDKSSLETIITQSEMSLTAFKDYQKIDEELNSTYQKILKDYQKNTAFTKMLTETQKAWVKFRNTEIDAKFPLNAGESGKDVYGSVYPTCISQELTKITKQRIAQLKVWLQEVPEGETCNGSIGDDKNIQIKSES